MYFLFSLRTDLSAVALTHPKGFRQGLGADSQRKLHYKNTMNIFLLICLIPFSCLYCYYSFLFLARKTNGPASHNHEIEVNIANTFLKVCALKYIPTNTVKLCLCLLLLTAALPYRKQKCSTTIYDTKKPLGS